MNRPLLTIIFALLLASSIPARIIKRQALESGSDNGNLNIGSDNGNTNGECNGNCADNKSGNGNGNVNVGDGNGNQNGNCEGNCVGNESGNANGNANTNSSNNGNNNGNCVGNCFYNTDGNANGNENLNTDGNGNNQGNCVGNCFDRLEGNGQGNENQEVSAQTRSSRCFGNCFGRQPVHKTSAYIPGFRVQKSHLTCISSDHFTYYVTPGTFCRETHRSYNRGGQHSILHEWKCPAGTAFDLDICACNNWYVISLRQTCRSGWERWAA